VGEGVGVGVVWLLSYGVGRRRGAAGRHPPSAAITPPFDAGVRTVGCLVLVRTVIG